jgi:hypothetical protein
VEVKPEPEPQADDATELRELLNRFSCVYLDDDAWIEFATTGKNPLRAEVPEKVVTTSSVASKPQ